MSERNRQTLSIDLDSLFPGETLEIGNQSIIIRPLSIEQIALLSKKLTSLGVSLAKQNVTWDNFNTPSSLFKLSSVILENFPDVLEEASDVNIDDLKVLPLELIVKIVDKIIEVNLKSKEDLEKNFKSLTEKFRPEIEEKKTEKKEKTPLKKIEK